MRSQSPSFPRSGWERASHWHVCPVEKLAVRGTNLIIFINLDRIGRGGGEGWGQKEEEEEEDAGVEG